MLKAQKHKQNHKNANKRTKIKNELKSIYVEKSHLFAYLRFVLTKKSLYNRNVGSTKPVKVLYEQKLVY